MWEEDEEREKQLWEEEKKKYPGGVVGVNEQVEFTLEGENFSLSRSDVIQQLRHVEPERLTEWFVEIGGKSYPPTQAIRESLHGKYNRNDITCPTNVARTTLRKLGLNSARQRRRP